ncbi:MAG TPA: M48 family metallopeptidase [Spongiibacteraceae bacterium]
MTVLAGLYFDGKTARGAAVEITFAPYELTLRGDDIDITVPIATIKLSPRLGRTRRQMIFHDGAVCELDDDPVFDRWFSENSHQHWNLLARFESHWGIILASALLIVAFVGVIAIWGLPWAAQKIAMRVPQPWVDQLGRGSLVALDNALGDESKLPAVRQQQLREKFAALAHAAAVPAKFEFRTWPQLGANALALPDSTIVMTDKLVEIADDDRELLAVIAHELGHEHERHALRQLLASSGVAALIFIMTGDVSGLSNVVVVAPTLLTNMHHSRMLEHDADRFGFALLRRSDIDPIWFARIIRKIETAQRDKDAGTGKNKNGYGSWLRMHPDSEERAREAEHYRDD